MPSKPVSTHGGANTKRKSKAVGTECHSQSVGNATFLNVLNDFADAERAGSRDDADWRSVWTNFIARHRMWEGVRHTITEYKDVAAMGCAILLFKTALLNGMCSTYSREGVRAHLLLRGVVDDTRLLLENDVLAVFAMRMFEYIERHGISHGKMNPVIQRSVHFWRNSSADRQPLACITRSDKHMHEFLRVLDNRD